MREQQRGSVIVLVSMIVVVFIVIAGIAVDSSLLASSQAQRRHTAEYIALEAMQEFNVTPGSFNTKLEAARVRAEEIAQVNFYVGRAFTSGGGTNDVMEARYGNTSASQNGRIIPGAWHHTPPTDCSSLPRPCPCNTDGTWAGPCFEEIDYNATPMRDLSGFHVELSLPVTSPFKTVLSKVNGDKSLWINVEATATFIPRHGVILAELSRNLHLQTHPPLEGTFTAPNVNRLSESSYDLTDTGCGPNNSNLCIGAPSGCQMVGGPYPMSIPFAFVIGMYDWLWRNGNPGYLTRPGGFNATRPLIGLSAPNKHYRDDYLCYDVNFRDNGGAVQNHAYLVDVREGNVTGGYSYGPEPLTTMVHGLHEFLVEAQSHKLPMDKFGVIGFDRSAGIDLRTLPLSDTSDPAYSSFMDAMTPSQKDTRMENYFFFPRHESGANYPEALKKALAMLRADPDAARARNFVAMIGTGLTDCDSNRICGRLETDYQAAMAETESILANEYVPNEVEFSFIQVGTMTRPHTILSKSVLNPNSCRTEREARAVNPPVMMVDETTGSSTLLATLNARGEPWSMTGPFYADPARLYRAVRATGGVFGAIRTPCLAAGVPADVTATLNAACQAAPSSGMKGGSPDQPIPVAVSPYTDANGRLICDPNGRSTRDQMRDYLKEILAGPPYLLVRDAKKLR